MQKLRADTIRDIAKTGTLTASMPAGSYVTIGGQQYTNTSAMSLNMGTNGAGGLDIGSIAANTTYYIYAIMVGGSMALIASASASAPTGFSPSKMVGALMTNVNTATINFIFAIGQDPGEPLINTAGAQTYADPTIVPVIPVPNLIINGAMDFWQRGVGPLDTSINRTYATVDRFMIGASGGSGGQIQSRSTTVPNSQFKYSVQQVENGDQVGNALMAFQKIEANNIRPYIGKQMTISLWVQFTTILPASPAIQIYTPVSGSEDSWNSDPLADTLVETQVISGLVLGNWSRISHTFVVPAGASNGLMVSFTSGTYNGQPTMRHTGWMLTPGFRAPDYFYRAGTNLADELAMCQRYYEKSYNINVAPGTTSADGQTTHIDMADSVSSTIGVRVSFKVTKRADISTMTFYNRTTGTTGSWESTRSNGGTLTGDGNVNVTSSSSSESSFGVNATGSIALAIGDAVRLTGHWTANAEL
jgi:hypothetical protein